jgi:hypothetical protein
MKESVKMCAKNNIRHFRLLLCLLMMGACYNLSWASEFSADVIMTGGPMPGDGKIWVKGQKMRQEIGTHGEKKIIIMDLDEGFFCRILQGGLYIKNKITSEGKGFRPENFMWLQQGLAEAQIEIVGKESVMGYECDKYLITFKNKEIGSMTQWFAIKLGYPIKTINKHAGLGEVTTELQNIKLGGVKDDLFQLPAGYTEIEQPLTPQIPNENQ